MATKDELVRNGMWASQADLVAGSSLFYFDVTVTAAALDAGTRTGKVYVVQPSVVPGLAGAQYKVRDIILVGGGTSFGAGGDCTLSLLDGTTTWTTIANADLESAPSASLPWGNTKVPMLTSTSNTASAAGASIYFQYASGTTAHTTGSIVFTVCLEKVA